MPENAFAGWATQPTERELASVLRDSYLLWHSLVAELKTELKLDRQEWNSYSAKAGWSLRLQSKKRNIVYLSPRTGSFLASFALGDKAVAAARNSVSGRGGSAPGRVQGSAHHWRRGPFHISAWAR